LPELASPSRTLDEAALGSSAEASRSTTSAATPPAPIGSGRSWEREVLLPSRFFVYSGGAAGAEIASTRGATAAWARDPAPRGGWDLATGTEPDQRAFCSFGWKLPIGSIDASGEELVRGRFRWKRLSRRRLRYALNWRSSRWRSSE
jgi:hypothetical protein